MRGRAAFLFPFVVGLALTVSAWVLPQETTLPATAETQVAGDPRSVLGPPRGPALTGMALESKAKQIAQLLRCPVCQGLSVADSPSSMATNIRGQVRELVAAGYEQEQILAYFERSYGEFVRLEPALRGVNWLVWLAPILGLLAGAAVVAWALGRQRTPSEPPAAAAGGAELPGRTTLPEDPALAAYVLRVRELAYGWPGGVPPSPGDPA
jgi:cytochrome c-type biogenesis protein CcmH